jgi:hypothetical protein
MNTLSAVRIASEESERRGQLLDFDVLESTSLLINLQNLHPQGYSGP